MLVKKLTPEAVIPTQANPGDAGLDLTATSYTFENGRHVYGTGLAVCIPDGFVGLLFPRSSICKKDLRLTNSVGVVDAGYRGEIKFIFENDMMIGREPGKPDPDVCYSPGCSPMGSHLIYEVGDRIGQLVLVFAPAPKPMEVDELPESKRGVNGFGSSGT
jgi:dUTP pyrophosphatase